MEYLVELFPNLCGGGSAHRPGSRKWRVRVAHFTPQGDGRSVFKFLRFPRTAELPPVAFHRDRDIDLLVGKR